MEEMMMIKNTTRTANPRKCSSSKPSHFIINSNSPNWKLYENPFYITKQPQDNHGKTNTMKQLQKSEKRIHNLQLPVSVRKISASLWDLSFIKPLMESELENGRAQILEMKAELEYERKERKKLDSVNKKLARELTEERKNKEAYESLCQKLAEEISSNKTEIDRLKKEIEEERKMLRVAEVLREERVQMKLSEAKLFLEEKLAELNERSISKDQENISPDENRERTTTPSEGRIDNSSGERRKSNLTEKSTMSNVSDGSVQSKTLTRRITSETANHHIRRGIKGFVEFPKMITAVGSKSHRRSGNKLEFHKAQIRMILKQKSPLKANNTIITS